MIGLREPILEVLEPILGAPVVLEELKHKPGRRTTSRAIGARRSAIVKVYASERAPTVAARIRALSEGPAEPTVPEVLLCDRELHLVALSEVPGVPLREALLAGDKQTCARAGAVIGAWHKAWLGISPDALVPHTADRELEILRSRIESASPGVSSAVLAALPRVAEGNWGAPTVVHRDLYEEQVMVDERIGLIDLDDAALSPPELDAGNLLGHLDLLELRSGRDLASLTETLLDAYREAGPPLDPALLARCRGLTLLRLACIHENVALLDRLPKPPGARRGPARSADSLERLADRPAWLVAIADNAAFEAALRRWVPELSSGDLTLRECAFERLRIKTGSRATEHRLAVVLPGGDERALALHGEVVPPDGPDPSPGPTGGLLGDATWRCFLPELRLDVRSEPAAGELPALSSLTDPEQARPLLEDAIRAGSQAYADLRIEACRPRVARLKGARATVLFDLDFPPEDRGRGWPTPVVVKTYRRWDKCREVYDGMSALWRSKLGADSAAVAVAEPLALLPDLNGLVQGPVPGDRTLTDLLWWALDAGTPEAIAEVSAYVRKSAVGIAEVHTCGATAGDELTWDDELAEVRELVVALAALSPEAARVVEPLLTRLEAVAARQSTEPPVPTHGSFRTNQVLLAEGGVGFIDFDGFCQAEPARDLALFRTAIRDFSLRPLLSSTAASAATAGERLELADGLAELFLGSYEAVAPVSRVRVALWETLDFLTLVLYSWTKLQTGLEHRLELLRRHLRTAELSP